MEGGRTGEEEGGREGEREAKDEERNFMTERYLKMLSNTDLCTLILPL